MSEYTPQTITAREVAEAGLKAIEENKLAVQHGLRCVYTTPEGYRCIVGTVLNDTTVEEIVARDVQSSTVNDLVVKGIIRVRESELATLMGWQSLHDLESPELASSLKDYLTAHPQAPNQSSDQPVAQS